MSLINELSKTVVQGQKVVSPNKFYHTVQLSTMTYNRATTEGNSFQLPLSVPIPKGAFILNAMFNIFVTPVGATLFFGEIGDPVAWDITSPIPIGVPWNQGTVPYEFIVGSKVEGDAITTANVQFNTEPSAGYFTLTFYFVV